MGRGFTTRGLHHQVVKPLGALPAGGETHRGVYCHCPLAVKPPGVLPPMSQRFARVMWAKVVELA